VVSVAHPFPPDGRPGIVPYGGDRVVQSGDRALKRCLATALWLCLHLLPRYAAAAELTENLTLGGDLRYRVEVIDQADRDVRHRHRVRARLALEAALLDCLTAKVEIGTGQSDDPVSDNQTLTDAASTKPLWTSLAYFDWRPMSWLRTVAGKMPNPFLRVGGSELLWDPDLHPEGLALALTPDIGALSPFVTMSVSWTRESGDGTDAWLAGLQGGARIALGEAGPTLTVGAGYVDHEGLFLEPPLWDDGDPAGNSTTKDGAPGGINYATDFDELELFGELAGASPWGPPWTVFASYVRNLAVPDVNVGWLAGARLGKPKHAWDWAVRYQYKHLEPDAVVGRFTDSDFGGGGTGARGHEVNLALRLEGGVQVGATGFVNTRMPFAGEEDDYHRLQLDVKARY